MDQKEIIEAWVRREYLYEGIVDPVEYVSIRQFLDQPEDGDYMDVAKVGDWFVSDEVTGTVVRITDGAVNIVWKNY